MATDSHRSQQDRWSIPRRWEWGILALILIVAAAFRFHQLDTIPPGLTHDEADFSHDAIAVYRGARPLYVATYGYQDEPLMHYASALVMTAMGPSHMAVRTTSALFGLLLVFLTFVWARMAFGAPVGLVASAWMAVSYWPLATSRFALQVEPTASIALAANIFLWLGLERDGESSWRSLLYWGGFTLCLAASIYAYEAPRITWVLFPAFALYLLVVRREAIRRHGWKMLVALLVAGVLALPLLTHPAAWDRAGRLAGPLMALREGDVNPLLESAWSVLGMFSFRGDPFVTYNLPGRPVFSPIASLFFYGGILVCVWRWRRSAYGFALLWLGVGIAPSLLTGLHSATLRSVVAKPVVYILPALALVEAVGWVARRVNGSAVFMLGVAIAIVMGGVGATTYRDYFVRWGHAPGTQAAYFSDVYQALRAVDAAYADRPVVLSSPFPNLPHDPYIARVMPLEHELDLHWVNGGRGMAFPEAESAYLAVLSRTGLHPFFREALVVESRAGITVEGSGERVDILAWQPEPTLDAMRAICSRTTAGADGTLDLPLDFGHAAELIAYQLEDDVAVGGTLRLVTLWRVLSPEPLGPVPPGYYGYDGAIFAQLIDRNGQVAVQDDRLDVPAWGWRSGEIFVQVHELPIGGEVPVGPYDLVIGLYARPEIRRLPVYVDSEERGDFVLLRTVEVISP